MRESLRDIARRVAEETCIPLDDIRGASRCRKVSQARQRAMVEAYATGRFSTTKVGNFFNRHHTTVLHALDSYEKRTGFVAPRFPKRLRKP